MAVAPTERWYSRRGFWGSYVRRGGTSEGVMMGGSRPTRRRSGGGRDGGWGLRLVAVDGCGAAGRSIGSAWARAAAPGSLAGPPHKCDGFPSGVGGGGRAVAGAGGARVRGAAVGTARRRRVASRSRSLFLARRRRRVRQQGTSRGRPYFAQRPEATARPTATRPQRIPLTRMRWSVTPTQHAACSCDV